MDPYNPTLSISLVAVWGSGCSQLDSSFPSNFFSCLSIIIQTLPEIFILKTALYD
jgi:hypothetical protein